MLCEECQSIAINVDGPNGLFLRDCHKKLKNSLVALEDSAKSCECCAYLVRHLPSRTPPAKGPGWKLSDDPQDGDVVLRRADPSASQRMETIGIFVGTLLGNPQIFQFAAKLDDPATQDERILCRKVGRNSRDHECIKFIEKRIKDCEQNHKDCAKAAIPQLPKRVLDVGTEGSAIKLVNGEGLAAPYIALSHCWGPPINPPIKTLTTNVDHRMRGVDFEELTQVFKDATMVTRALGIRYIWIDALCIIQDSLEDWRDQAAKMASIYSNATLTVSSSCSPTSHDTFFKDRVRDFSPALPFSNAAKNIHGNIYLTRGESLSGYGNIWYHTHGSQPLQQRGWTYQERLLSQRIVSYDVEDLVWECDMGLYFENYERLVTPDFAPPFKKLERISREQQRGYKTRIVSVSAPYSEENPWIQKEDLRPEDGFYPRWYEILKEFGRREISYRDDILPAMSGIAATFAALTGDTYIAGMWKSDFPGGLTWEVLPKKFDIEISTSLSKASERSPLAPTWSWACLLGKRKWNGHNGDFVLARAKKLQSAHEALLMDWDLCPLGEDPMGQLKYCHLTIQGWCRPIQALEPADGGKQYSFAARFKEDEGISISCTVDEPDIDVTDSPALLCLALGEWSLARHFVVPTLLCLIIKSTGENNKYMRVGTMRINTPVDPAATPGVHQNIHMTTFDGLWGHWEQKIVVLV